MEHELLGVQSGRSAVSSPPPLSPPTALFLEVALQQQHDGRVALRRLLELVQRDLVVVVLVHLGEDLVHPLLGRQAVLVHLHHDHRAHHLVDRLQTQGGKRAGPERRGDAGGRGVSVHSWSCRHDCVCVSSDPVGSAPFFTTPRRWLVLPVRSLSLNMYFNMSLTALPG